MSELLCCFYGRGLPGVCEYHTLGAYILGGWGGGGGAF